MQQLFENNIYLIYFFACVVIYNYPYKVKQKLTLIYVATFGLNFIGSIGTKMAMVLLMIVLFLFLEYLTDDSGRIKIFNRLIYKILDYLYFAIFQYSIIFILIAMILNSNFVCIKFSDYIFIIKIISILVFIFGIHRLSSQQFILKSFDQILNYFLESTEFFKPQVDEEFTKYKLLCEVEDKSYFERKKCYNFISLQFIKNKYKRLKLQSSKDGNYILKYISKGKIWRGYSTLEMQLIRIIAIESGFRDDKYVKRRKIYELLYTEIFFKGLKRYYDDNVYTRRKYFKEYLLYVYFNNVPTKINGKDYPSFATALGKDISKWTLDEVFVASLGLNHREISAKRMNHYYGIISSYGLNRDNILKIANKLGEKNQNTL